jgi:hypothetical protein
MRYLTLTILLSGALAAQTQNWRQPDLPQYFKQFKFPQVQPRQAAPASEPRKCAIPLINVLKKDATHDRMIFIRTRPACRKCRWFRLRRLRATM